MYQSLSATYNQFGPYQMTVGLIGGTGVTAGDSLDLIFYYDNGSGMTVLGDTNVPGDANKDLTQLEFFTVTVPTLPANSPAIGQNIGIAVLSNGFDGGFWTWTTCKSFPSRPPRDCSRSASGR